VVYLKKLKFKKIDAFTDGISSGNPAGCIYIGDSSRITDEEMQKIATELKGYVNEVAYVFEEKELSLRYFSSECEVDFCGHATIALMYDLIKNNKELSKESIVKIKVKQDTLEVFNDTAHSNAVFITAPKPIFQNTHIENAQVSEALKIDPVQIHDQYKTIIVNAGLNTLIVPIKGLENVLKINPCQMELKEFCLEHDIDIVVVFTGEVANSSNSFRTRVFAPKFGYLEDPATGSGNAAFGYYLLKFGLWDGEKINIEQNNSFMNSNTIALKAVTKGNEIHVTFGGSAVVRIEGEYILN
jgi:PhzF family phenazine biosynthesis protein